MPDTLRHPLPLHEDPAHHWYLAQVKPNAGAIAARNLSRQGFATFMPHEEITQVARGQFVAKRRPVFPGYVFVSFDPACGHWRRINATYGVVKLVSFGGTPGRVPAGLVAEFAARCNSDGVLSPDPGWQPGDRAVVAQGPFAGFAAEVAGLAEQQRVWVLLDVMGARRRVAVAGRHLGRA